MTTLKPKDFNTFPWGSVKGTSEHETVAQNIMAILQRTGNKFRHLSWEEYKEERIKDGNFSEREKGYFLDVYDFCVSPQTAVLFSPTWKEIIKG